MRAKYGRVLPPAGSCAPACLRSFQATPRVTPMATYVSVAQRDSPGVIHENNGDNESGSASYVVQTAVRWAVPRIRRRLSAPAANPQDLGGSAARLMRW